MSERQPTSSSPELLTAAAENGANPWKADPYIGIFENSALDAGLQLLECGAVSKLRAPDGAASDALRFNGLLHSDRSGDRSAVDRMMGLVYQELRCLAASYLRRQASGHTLQPTALVHEAYLRLVYRASLDWKDRVHFFSLAATLMRQILVDHARSKGAVKRGGGRVKVEFKDTLNYSDEKAADLVALDDALQRLAAFDERKARTIELRYFGGLSIEDTAETLGVSVATVGRETRYAEAWLQRELARRLSQPAYDTSCALKSLV
ncbi:MAG: sigma-70 family RNA polymerase sigma factor [Acidobacteriaceae bacterium]|nr:sigma-70 family RNA polymerase sigma factor [Acidobacteriaceae bacterium]